MRYQTFLVCKKNLGYSMPDRVDGPSRACLAMTLLAGATLGGCVLAPAGLHEERAKLEEVGSAYEPPLEKRALPELFLQPEWRELLARAFAANGEIEARYFDWKAALERVAIAAGYPNTNLAPSFSYLLSGGQMKAWDRTTVNVGFDPMQNLSLPGKVRKAGEIALQQAREAGRQFAAAKFALQRQVLDNWLELALLEERARIQQRRVDLAAFTIGSAEQRAVLKGGQRDLLYAQVEQREAQIELAKLQSETRASRAMLNGLLARDPDAPLELGPTLPKARVLPVDDATLIAAGVDSNPELQAQTFSVTAREGMLEFARLQYLPDFNPFAGFTGSVVETIGVGVSLPTRLPQIRAGIREATALLSGARAELRQMKLDRRASFVAALYVLRFSETELSFLMQEVAPSTRSIQDSMRQSYATGAANFLELIDALRLLLDVDLAIAEARIERERRLAEIEQLAGIDIETLAPWTGQQETDVEFHRHE